MPQTLANAWMHGSSAIFDMPTYLFFTHVAMGIEFFKCHASRCIWLFCFKHTNAPGRRSSQLGVDILVC